MFSERFTVIDKYSLTTQEKISTIEIMPRRFTSLVDSSYLPALDSALIEKINKFFNFHQGYTQDFGYEFDKDFYIEHSDGNVIEYYAKYLLGYETLMPIWNKFVRITECPELNNVKAHIDKMTSATDAAKTWVGGIRYNTDGSFSGITVADSTYDLDEYASNDYLARVNDFPLVRPDLAQGAITFFSDSDDISYKIVCKINKTFDKTNEYRYVEDRNKAAMAYLDIITRDPGPNLLTAEQKAFVESTCTANTWFDLEFIITQSGECSEIYLHHHVMDGFEDLTTA